MSVLTLEAKLERVDPSTPWGFRMQGGKDFNCPLTIQRVTPGSLAAKCGLLQGDRILKIGDGNTSGMVHKEAQTKISSSGNKLDLLLERIRDKRRSSSSSQGGGVPPQYNYEKFETPNRPPQPSAPPAPPAPPAFQPSPVGLSNAPSRPYSGSSGVDSITQKTQNISFNVKPAPVAPPADFSNAAQKYTERDDKPSGASYQSASFRHLQTALDGGQDPPSALRPINNIAPNSVQTNRRTPSPQPPSGVVSARPVTVTQFNSPSGLYSKESKAFAQKQQRSSDEDSDSQQKIESDVDEFGRKVYRPSETFLLVHEQESDSGKSSAKSDDNYKVNPSKTFKKLQSALDTGEITSAPPKAPQEVSASIAADKLSEVLSEMPKIQPLVSDIPLEEELPPEVLSKMAPKPNTWSPAAPAAPTAKPFSPSVPSAPGGPRPVPKPTGVGAVRGKKGDVAMFKAGDTVPGGNRVPVCSQCNCNIRGPFVVALQKTWCPDHFVCSNPKCATKLLDIGFVEEGGFLYCEKDYEQYFAPHCAVCSGAIIGECVNALNKTYHPECFRCHHCQQPIGGNQFHLEDGHPYCENDWRKLYQTMCKACEFPIEPGDRWVEAMGNNYHSECFNCSTCQVNLEGQPFYAKAGKPFCKKHAR